MLNPNFQSKLDEMINTVYKENAEEIGSALLSGVDSTQDTMAIYHRMIQNSMRISSMVSTKIVLELLKECGIISISEDSRYWLKILRPDD